eukprot:4635312-Pyramimonas_sp.AAC.1
MRAAPLGPQVELPTGARSVRGVCQNGAAAPCELRHWALGGAPYGATKRVRDVPKWGGGAMQAALLGP